VILPTGVINCTFNNIHIACSKQLHINRFITEFIYCKSDFVSEEASKPYKIAVTVIL